MEPLTLFGLGTNIMFSLGIVFAIVFIIFYMRQRFSDYNHKLNSMFQLISAMADELNSLKNKVSPNSNKLIDTDDNEDNELMKLVVSDDDSESDNDSEESDSDDEDGLDTVDYNNVIVNNLSDTTLDLSNENMGTLTINNDLEQVVLEEVSQDIATGNTSKEDIKLIELTSTVDDNDELDINKMTVKQLKDLVTQRGLSFEQSAKKKDLIKLLEENHN